MTTPEPFLHIENLCASLGGSSILQGVSLQLAAGERAALLGESGSGKSTLLRCLAGLQPVQEGRIRLGGRLLQDREICVPPAARGIAMVFQSYALWPHLTVRQHLELVAADRTLVGSWLDHTRLTDRAHRLPGQLSGGEQARLALARALVAAPALLLLDEPFRNLDPGLARELREEVFETLEERRLTVLMVTHDHHEAFLMADAVHVLHGGRLLASGPPRQLYEQPTSATLARFLGRSMRLPIESRDGALARTCLGPVPLADTANAGALLLRPEDLEVVRDPQGEAAVRRARYEGGSILLDLCVGDQKFVARVAPDATYRTGDPVRIRVRRALRSWPPATREQPV